MEEGDGGGRWRIGGRWRREIEEEMEEGDGGGRCRRRWWR